MDCILGRSVPTSVEVESSIQYAFLVRIQESRERPNVNLQRLVHNWSLQWDSFPIKFSSDQRHATLAADAVQALTDQSQRNKIRNTDSMGLLQGHK